jgi:soluble lytic murein transglycosylase
VAAPRTIESKRAVFAQAHADLRARRYSEAAAQLEGLCPVYPELEDYCLHDLALSRARSGDGASAEAAWAQLAAAHPQSLLVPRATLERARLRRAQGDVASARALLETARAGSDDDIALEALIELAALDLAAGNSRAAYDHLMAVRTLAPGTPLGREAKRQVEDLRAREPDLNPRGAAQEVELDLLLKERDFSGARSAADQLLLDAPEFDRPGLLRRRADAELGAGDTDSGLLTLQEIVRQYPDSSAAPDAQYRYATLLWNRDRNAEARVAFLELRHRYPRHSRVPDALYALARIAQSDGDTDQAIATYAELADAYPSSNVAREARWRIGWIYYQQGRWRDAAAAFERVGPSSGSSTAADADYWRARALEQAGDRGRADVIYGAIVSETPANYYAQWAEQRLGRSPATAHAIDTPPPAQFGPAPPGSDPYHWVRAYELHAVALQPLARAELRAYERGNADAPNATAATLTAYQAVDGYRDAIRLGSARGFTDPQIFFPLAFWPEVSRQTAAHAVDPLLVLALMRQESMFDPAARSPADARGLMQLLPSTAERVAGTIGQPALADRLYDPDANVTLGVAHMQELLQRYQGNELKVLAAYNGGVAAVAKWEDRYGALPPDEFVESITYRETRDYVKRVIGNYRRYQMEYGGS